MNTRIIVDSTTDLPVDMKNRLTVVPLTVHFGEEEYQDGITISHTEFYNKLETTNVYPTTSQPTPFSFMNVFEKAKKANEEVIVITVSSKLSGTYQSATIAAEDFDNVYIVDSNTVAIGTGILAAIALNLADKGMDAKYIADHLIEERENIAVIAVFDTLEYLKRGGRISKAAALAGGMLSIKPVIGIENGEIEIRGKARGTKQGNTIMTEEIQKLGGINFDKPVLLGYTGNSDLLLKKYIQSTKEKWKLDEIPATMIGSVIGTHAGPGAYAIAFFKK